VNNTSDNLTSKHRNLLLNYDHKMSLLFVAASPRTSFLVRHYAAKLSIRP